MRRALLLAASAVAAVCVTLAAGAAAAPDGADALASAVVARLAVPGQPALSPIAATAPPDGTGGGPLALPEDGSALRLGTSSVDVKALPGTSSSAEARLDALGITLLGGEVVVERIELRASAVAGSTGAAAETRGSTVQGLVVLGQPVEVTETTQLALADWGILQVLPYATDVDGEADPRRGEATASGVRVELIEEHLGYPAGTVIEVGLVEAAAVAASPPAEKAPVTTDGVVPAVPGSAPGRASDVPLPPAQPAVPVPAPSVTPSARADREPGESIAGAPPALVQSAPVVATRLSSGGYVFPIFGPASFGDSFGAYRGDVPGRWHHGEDIVAPAGTPILAVASGTVFSVGWNAIGGWRLWLRDDAGNEFYYAHLSAYSPAAVDGRRVSAGDVLGFVGSTGDAEGGIPHLHFEIHPVELLALGYDGVVAPYPFLVAWRRAEDVSFIAGRRYVPDEELRPGVGLPRVGAYVLEMNDIGQTSGLVPGALGKALGDPVAGRLPS